MKILPKVHKDPGPKGHLQSRPVVNDLAGLSSRAGDQLSDLLEPLVTLELPRVEDLSTEEVLSQLEEAQDLIKSNMRTDTVVGSLDVKALYPSLDQLGSAKLVAKFVKNSRTEVLGGGLEAGSGLRCIQYGPPRAEKRGSLQVSPCQIEEERTQTWVHYTRTQD